MAQSTINSDLYVRGRLTPTQLDIPSGTVDNAAVSASAAIATTKLNHRHQASYAQPNTTATTETRTLHVCRAAGTIMEFVAGSIAACAGAATITLDLKKNGTSVLTTILTLDNANTARVHEAAVLNSSLTTVAAGDWLEVVITATAGGGTLGTGLFCSVQIDVAAS